MQRTDAREQLCVTACVRRWFAYQPRVVTAHRDPEQSCHRGNGPAGPVHSHESVPPFGGMDPVSLANQAAA